jgi:type IX secretion system PorP/SprF family membrane protein
MMRKALMFTLLLCLSRTLLGQDFHYSQFYAAPLFLNPALTGSTELSRVGLNYRKQWPGLSQDFNAYSAYFDHYSFDLNSGFGFAVHSFNESNMNLNTTDISFLYSYKLQLAEAWALRFGGQAAWVRRNATLDNLVFGDQVNLFTRSINATSIDQVPDIEPYGYLMVKTFGWVDLPIM